MQKNSTKKFIINLKKMKTKNSFSSVIKKD